MRVCILNEFFYPDSTGGTGTVLSNLARELHVMHENIEIDVVTSRNQYRGAAEALLSNEHWNGINIHRLSSPRAGKKTLQRLFANFIFSCMALLYLLRQRRYDVVLVGTAPPTSPIAARMYRRLTGTPYVYVTYDLEPDRAIALGVISRHSRLATLLTALQRRWIRDASKIIVLGRCMQHYLESHYALSADKLAIIPIGFHPDHVVPTTTQTCFRAQHGLQGFVALYAGNFGRYHNFDSILDAAKAVKNNGITFALIGNGAQSQHIQDRVQHESIDNVKVFPFVPVEEFADMIASADICMVTLEKGMEGLCVPSKLYSNMAAGRATLALASEKSEVAQVVIESASGVQVDPGDTANLIQTLHKLSACPELVEQMGRNARRTLEKLYATPQIAEMYYDVFVEVTRSLEKSAVLAEAPMAVVHISEDGASREPMISASHATPIREIEDER